MTAAAAFLVVCDPAWLGDSGGGGRGAQSHYALEGIDAIALSMRSSSPWTDAGPGLLWMWATTTAFVSGDAQTLARMLGFRPCASSRWRHRDGEDGPIVTRVGA